MEHDRILDERRRALTAVSAAMADLEGEPPGTDRVEWLLVRLTAALSLRLTELEDVLFKVLAERQAERAASQP